MILLLMRRGMLPVAPSEGHRDIVSFIAVSSPSLRQELNTHISNPAWLTVRRRGGDKAVAGHPDQPEILASNNWDATAKAERRLTELLSSITRPNIPLIVKFQVEFRILFELVSYDGPANPRVRDGFAFEPIANFAADPDPADLGVCFDRKKHLRSRFHYVAHYRAGRIVQYKLRVDRRAKLDFSLTVAHVRFGMVFVKAVFHSEHRIPQTCDGMARIAARFLDAQGHFVFELDPASDTVIDVDIRSFIGTLEGIALADEPGINLPMSVSGSVGIVRLKGRSALSYRECRKQYQGSY
jgi:hypothetical protein